MGRSFPELAWNSVGLSPVSVVSRCIRARSRNTLSVVRANRIVLDPDQAELGQCFSRLRSMAHRPGPSDPSWIDLAWPLRRQALLPDAGCVGPTGLRARFSGRARPRPGRIRSSFRWTAPFETELPHLRFTLNPEPAATVDFESFAEACTIRREMLFAVAVGSGLNENSRILGNGSTGS